jgi:hypothetical protein
VDTAQLASINTPASCSKPRMILVDRENFMANLVSSRVIKPIGGDRR